VNYNTCVITILNLVILFRYIDATALCVMGCVEYVLLCIKVYFLVCCAIEEEVTDDVVCFLQHSIEGFVFGRELHAITVKRYRLLGPTCIHRYNFTYFGTTTWFTAVQI
jgi:hypothetical protein